MKPILKTSVTLLKGPLDVVPWLNVFFLLVLFFVLSSHYLTQPGVPVVLSDSILSSSTSVNRRVLTLTSNGEIYFDDQKIEWKQLTDYLRSYAKSRSTPALVLKADVAVKQGQVMYVVREAVTQGIEVVLATQKAAPKK